MAVPADIWISEFVFIVAILTISLTFSRILSDLVVTRLEAIPPGHRARLRMLILLATVSGSFLVFPFLDKNLPSTSQGLHSNAFHPRLVKGNGTAESTDILRNKEVLSPKDSDGIWVPVMTPMVTSLYHNLGNIDDIRVVSIKQSPSRDSHCGHLIWFLKSHGVTIQELNSIPSKRTGLTVVCSWDGLSDSWLTKASTQPSQLVWFGPLPEKYVSKTLGSVYSPALRDDKTLTQFHGHWTETLYLGTSQTMNLGDFFKRQTGVTLVKSHAPRRASNFMVRQVSAPQEKTIDHVTPVVLSPTFIWSALPIRLWGKAAVMHQKTLDTVVAMLITEAAQVPLVGIEFKVTETFHSQDEENATTACPRHNCQYVYDNNAMVQPFFVELMSWKRWKDMEFRSSFESISPHIKWRPPHWLFDSVKERAKTADATRPSGSTSLKLNLGSVNFFAAAAQVYWDIESDGKNWLVRWTNKGHLSLPMTSLIRMTREQNIPVATTSTEWLTPGQTRWLRLVND